MVEQLAAGTILISLTPLNQLNQLPRGKSVARGEVNNDATSLPPCVIRQTTLPAENRFPAGKRCARLRHRALLNLTRKQPARGAWRSFKHARCAKEPLVK